MKLCRFTQNQDQAHLGLLSDDAAVLDLTAAGIDSLETLLENPNHLKRLRELSGQKLVRLELAQIQLLAPIEQQEVWAAGVTYHRSKKARMDESQFSATAYDRVYDAQRPELFFKSLPEKVVPAGEPVGIRRDARWSVPEPELALVLNSKGKVVGYTIGNDMSSRDIEGENLLYLPQAKIYNRSCALGPWITLGEPEATAREWEIRLQIRRKDQQVFCGKTTVNQIKRSFDDLAGFLFRSQVFTHGAILLTGTGVVPPDTFTLEEGDVVEIDVSGIGVLRNPVIVV